MEPKINTIKDTLNIDENEPVFLLRAKDPIAPVLIRMWAEIKHVQDKSDMEIFEAYDISRKMETWRKEHPTTEDILGVATTR